MRKVQLDKGGLRKTERNKYADLDDSDIFFCNDNFPLQAHLCIIPKEGMKKADNIIKALGPDHGIVNIELLKNPIMNQDVNIIIKGK